ncbi:hypothetical protein Pelo_18775 [Pelomyxa schiedti]|nr:hypothetical protein Pelo_18775 [Pelomyxa schiedti]
MPHQCRRNQHYLRCLILVIVQIQLSPPILLKCARLQSIASKAKFVYFVEPLDTSRKDAHTVTIIMKPQTLTNLGEPDFPQYTRARRGCLYHRQLVTDPRQKTSASHKVILTTLVEHIGRAWVVYMKVAVVQLTSREKELSGFVDNTELGPPLVTLTNSFNSFSIGACLSLMKALLGVSAVQGLSAVAQFLAFATSSHPRCGRNSIVGATLTRGPGGQHVMMHIWWLCLSSVRIVRATVARACEFAVLEQNSVSRSGGNYGTPLQWSDLDDCLVTFGVSMELGGAVLLNNSGDFVSAVAHSHMNCEWAALGRGVITRQVERFLL